MNGKLLTALLTAVTIAPVALAQTLEVAGSQDIAERFSGATMLNVNAASEAHALIDLLDGKVEVAAIDESLEEAIATARIAAFAQRRLLAFPDDTTHHVVSRDGGYSFVTIGVPSAAVLEAMAQLRSVS